MPVSSWTTFGISTPSPGQTKVVKAVSSRIWPFSNMQPAIWVTRSRVVSRPVASRSNSQMRLRDSASMCSSDTA